MFIQSAPEWSGIRLVYAWHFTMFTQSPVFDYEQKCHQIQSNHGGVKSGNAQVVLMTPEGLPSWINVINTEGYRAKLVVIAFDEVHMLPACEFPGSGNLITFAQFFLISVEGFIFTTHFGTKAPVIPIKNYFILVFFFFTTSVINNYALNFNIPLPLHMIFRSGSLVANMALGIILLQKKYEVHKYISVLMITIGIFICTLMSAKSVGEKHASSSETSGQTTTNDILMWVIGLCMLTFALFMSARMGIYQEVLYSKFGKHSREALFYSHALPLLGFAVLGKDIYNQAVLFSTSDPMTIPILEASVPKMWVYMAGNMITQYVCIRGVFILTTECPSLVVTLIVTLRKFFSLVFSIMYFRNPFTLYHWFGTACVFTGIFLFTGVFHMIRDFLLPPSKTKKLE